MSQAFVAGMATMGSVAGAVAGLIALRRLPHIEVPASPVAEARVLAALDFNADLREPLREVAEVSAGHFTLADHVRAFESLMGSGSLPTDLHDLAQLAEARDAGLAERDATEIGRACAKATGETKLRDRRDALAESVALSHLLGEHDERIISGSITTLEPTGEFDPPLRRTPGERTVARIIGPALFAGALALLAGLSLSSGQRTGAQLYAAGFLVLLPTIFGATALATVDIYTLFLDTRFAAGWALALGASTVLADLVIDAGIWWPAIVAGITIVGLMELLRLVFLRVRGLDGHGLGDSLVMPILLGLPWAVAVGTERAPILPVISHAAYTVMAAGALSILAAAWMKIRHGGKLREMRMAALPAWAAAPFLAWPIVQSLGLSG